MVRFLDAIESMVLPGRENASLQLMWIKGISMPELDAEYAQKRRGRVFAGSREEGVMVKLLAIVFVLALSSFAQAVPLAPRQQPNDLAIKVRQACGPGMHWVNGSCIRTPARRAASRCARGVTC